MKKLILFMLCCALLAGSAFGMTIDRLTTDCTVEEDGDCLYTQTLELSGVEPTEELSFPISGSAVDIDAEGGKATVTNGDGKKIVTLHGTFSDSVTVKISYRLQRCAEKTEEGQKLTAELVSGQLEEDAARYSFTVMLPKETEAQPKFTSSYYADGVEDVLTVGVKGRTIAGFLREGLKNHSLFTMTLETEPDYFSASRGAVGAGQWIATALLIALCALCLVYWFLMLRSPRLRPQARTLPPDGVTPAELPLLLCGESPRLSLLVCDWASFGYLRITEKRGGGILLQKSMDMGAERREEERRVFDLLFHSGDVCEADSPRWKKAAEAAASLLQHFWRRRLYDRASGGSLVPRVLSAIVSALALLSAMQRILPSGGATWLLLVLSFFVGGALGALVSYGVCRWAVRDLRWAGVGAGAALVLFLLARVGGTVLTMLLALALCVFVGLLLRRGGRLTAAGRDAVEQSIGFARYLDHAEPEQLGAMAERDSQSLLRLLVYGSAAGLNERLAKRLGDTEIEPCPWLSAADGSPLHAALFCGQLARIITKLDTGK